MKTTLLFLSIFLSATFFSQNVYIPDANFKAYLVSNSAINTNGDTEIQISEASGFNGLIDCDNLGIYDLTGIEAFTALIELQCNENQLTSLDLSNNTNLGVLICDSNQLECLNVKNGNNADLFYLSAYNNPDLACIEVDNINYSSAFWINIDTQTSYSQNCNNDCSLSSVGIKELTTFKNLIKIIDMMGRETIFKPNTPLIYVYNDGSIEKVFSVEY